jgi:hypothetical protein
MLSREQVFVTFLVVYREVPRYPARTPKARVVSASFSRAEQQMSVLHGGSASIFRGMNRDIAWTHRAVHEAPVFVWRQKRRADIQSLEPCIESGRTDAVTDGAPGE